MDEKPEFPKEDISNLKKEAINKELDSFINPKKDSKPLANQMTNPAPIPGIPEPTNLSAIGNMENKNPAIIKPVVRTYKSDVEETIQSGHLSSINIAISENKKILKQGQTDVEEVKKKKINKNIIIISIVLIVGGALTALVPYVLVQNQYGPKVEPVDPLAAQPIIITDTEEKINIKDLNLERVSLTLEERVEQSLIKLGQVKNIFLTKGDVPNEAILNADEFLKLIKANVPATLQRTLKPKYMFGMHNFNGNQKFLILKVGSYDTAFSSMLSWEDNLWQDFKDLFALKSTEPAIINTEVATDTEVLNPDSLNSSIIEIKKFQDASFSNKDCRIVRDNNGKIVFLYSIIDDSTIVITTSTDTLKEIVARINRAKVTQ